MSKSKKIKGTSNNDLLYGTSGKDKIDGRDGDDTIFGLSGNDELKGGKGDDTLDGGDGKDRLDGGKGNDTLFGGAGDDRLKGGAGDDTLDGGQGDDKIEGGDGNDVVFGGAGDDEISGGDGNDIIFGGDGDDRIYGDGSGMGSGGGSGSGSGNPVSHDDYLSGGAGNDFIVGGEGQDTVLGGAGNDILFGDDTADYGSGSGKGSGSGVENGFADYLDGGAGNDLVFGGGGNDEAVYTAAENVGAIDVYDGGRGIDTLTLNLTNDEWFNPVLQADIASYLVFLAAHTDPITGEADNAIFTFSAFNLSASAFENLQVFVDGVAQDPVDEAVTANADASTINEDDPATVFGTVLVNDVVPDLIKSVSLVSGPAQGVLVFNTGTIGNADGSFSFDPSGDFQDLALGESRDVTFTYEVEDADGDTAQATVTITVTGSNDGPVAIIDTATTDENVSITVDVLANDTDVDISDTHTLDAVSVPANSGTATVVGNQVQWNPGADFDFLAVGESTVVTVSYDMSDNNGATASSTLDITVTGSNDAPVISGGDTVGAVAEAGQTSTGNLIKTSAVTGNGNQQQFAGTILANDLINIGSASLAAVAVTNYSPFTPTGTASPGAPGFVLNDGSNGISSNPTTGAAFDLDGEFEVVYNFDLGANAAGFDLTRITTYSAHYDNRTAQNFEVFVDYAADGPGGFVSLGLFTGANAGGTHQASRIVLESGTNPGSGVFASGVGAIRFEFNAPIGNATTVWREIDVEGTASGSLTDAGNLAFGDVDLSDTHTVSVAENGTSYLGTMTAAVSDSSTGDGAGSIDWNFAVNDSAVNYLAQGETLIQSYDITVDDGNGGTATETVSVTITGTNDAPVANADAGSTDENTSITIAVLSNDTDVDVNDTRTVDAVSVLSGLGVASVVAGQVVWDPGVDYDYLAVGEVATVELSYDISDNNGGSSSSTVTITVTGTNDIPVANVDYASTNEDTAIDIDVLGNDTDVDTSDMLTVASVDGTSASGATLTINPDGTINYDPVGSTTLQAMNTGQSVVDTFNYMASDGNGGWDSAIVSITVAGANDGPEATDDVINTDEDTSTFINVLANDAGFSWGKTITGFNGGGISGQTSALGAGLSIQFGQVVYDPLQGAALQALEPGQTGVDTFTYTMQDSAGNISTATVTINVAGLAEPVVIDSGVNTVMGFDTLYGNPGSYTEDGMTVTSLYPGSAHLHDYGDDIYNHSGCCSTPYEFTYFNAANGDTSFSMSGFTNVFGSGQWTSSAGGSQYVGGSGAISLGVDFQNVEWVRWHEASGNNVIDDVLFTA